MFVYMCIVGYTCICLPRYIYIYILANKEKPKYFALNLIQLNTKYKNWIGNDCMMYMKEQSQQPEDQILLIFIYASLDESYPHEVWFFDLWNSVSHLTYVQSLVWSDHCSLLLGTFSSTGLRAPLTLGLLPFACLLLPVSLPLFSPALNIEIPELYSSPFPHCLSIHSWWFS